MDAFSKFSQSVVEVSSLIPCDMCLLIRWLFEMQVNDKLMPVSA